MEEFKKRQQAAKNLILKIISLAEPEGLLGRVRLFKAFYYSHLNYMKTTGQLLTRWAIIHMPFGPGIDNSELLTDELIDEKSINAESVDGTKCYKLGSNAILPAFNSKAEKAIEQAVQYVIFKTAKFLSDKTHETSRSWKETTNGEIQNIALDLLTDEQLQAIEKALEPDKDIDEINGIFLTTR